MLFVSDIYLLDVWNACFTSDHQTFIACSRSDIYVIHQIMEKVLTLTGLELGTSRSRAVCLNRLTKALTSRKTHYTDCGLTANVVLNQGAFESQMYPKYVKFSVFKFQSLLAKV